LQVLHFPKPVALQKPQFSSAPVKSGIALNEPFDVSYRNSKKLERNTAKKKSIKASKDEYFSVTDPSPPQPMIGSFFFIGVAGFTHILTQKTKTIEA
jgi:hypothetical protein